MHYYFPVVIGMFITGFGMYSSCTDQETDIVANTEKTIYLTGVFDRIEDGEQAVILIKELKKEQTVPLDTLPPGSRVHMWYDVLLNEAELKVIRVNHQATKKAWDKVREGQERLGPQ